MGKSRIAAGLLLASGVVLLIVGGVLAYPYVHSRLATSSSLTVATPMSLEPSATTTGLSAPQATRVIAKTTVHTPEASLTPSPAPISTTTPATTPVPVEFEAQEQELAPPSRIVIPVLGVEGPVVPVSLDKIEVEGQIQSVWGVPDERAAGWHESSASLGEAGNMVLNGHNTNNGEIFRDLYTLEVGEEIIVYSGEISRTYAVSQILILPEGGQPLEVRLANAQYVLPTDDERLTLVTCHPYGSLRNRLIVIARPPEFNPSSEPPED